MMPHLIFLAAGVLSAKGEPDIYTLPIIASQLTSDTPMGQIAQLLEKRHIKRTKVADDGKLVGIVSRANLLQAAAAQSVVHIRSEADEDEKSGIVLGALGQVPRPSPVQLNVLMADNRVDVWGI